MTFPQLSLPASETTLQHFSITDDGYLISNRHVVKDAANDLVLLKAAGRFASLPIISSRTAQLGGTVATIGFPDIGLQGFAPNEVDEWQVAGDTISPVALKSGRRKVFWKKIRCRWLFCGHRFRRTRAAFRLRFYLKFIF